MYIFLVGEPGIGKSRSITCAANIIREALPKMHFGATSMTRASLSDYMNEAKVFYPNIPYAPIEYNSMLVVADEFSAFMHEYDTALVAALVEFYDVNPYSEGRRVSSIRITIKRPQLSLLTGSTPSNLLHTLKDYVWDQGLMSRVIMVYANERPLIDVFNTPPAGEPKDLINDIKIINSLFGQFDGTAEFKAAMHNWKLLGLTPAPDHPRLKHYSTRRWAHLLKLCMISSVDRKDELLLDVNDFNRAMNWLLEAELLMPYIFQVGSVTPDSRIMDDIAHYVKQKGVIPEHLLINFARQRLHPNAIKNVIEMLMAAKQIVAEPDNKGRRKFKAPGK
jgi:hypothetical protein